VFKPLGEYIKDLLAQQVPPVQLSRPVFADDLHIHHQHPDHPNKRVYCVSDCRADTFITYPNAS
jgi:hypothetical protein